jgi:hypothetical protein
MGGEKIRRFYTDSFTEAMSLIADGWKLDSVAYFVNGDGVSIILSK